jgi:hypothetical protein
MILKYPALSGAILGCWPLLLLLSGCSKTPNIHTEPVTMTVVEIVDASSNWSCIGTNDKTLLRGDDGRVAHICGKWGNPGDKIRGCWHSGHEESINGDSAYQNGFHTDLCEKK